MSDFKPCILWTGATDRRGYGRVKHGQKGRRQSVLAHRLAYAEANGLRLEDLAGQVVFYSCDNPPCVNPDHLFLGTQADNLADMVAKGRSTRGSRNPNRKLTEEEVLRIRRLHSKGTPGTALAQMFNVNAPSISMIVNRRTWKHV